MSDFPIWKNLHVYWRNSPRYNQYCPGAESERENNKCITINHSRKELTAKRRKLNAQRKSDLQGVSKVCAACWYYDQKLAETNWAKSQENYIDVDAIKLEGSLHAKLSRDMPTDTRV